MSEGKDQCAPPLEGQREPELIVRARIAIKHNPGYVTHGPDVCPRDIIEAYQLGRAEPPAVITSAVNPAPGQIGFEAARFFIRNPLRTVSSEALERLSELATDLECGLAVHTSIISDWTSAAERTDLDGPALIKLAYERLAADIRSILGAVEDGAADQE